MFFPPRRKALAAGRFLWYNKVNEMRGRGPLEYEEYLNTPQIQQAERIAAIGLWGFAALLVLFMAFVAAALVRGRKKTLYSYRNAGLLGGLLYLSFVLYTVLRCLIFDNRMGSLMIRLAGSIANLGQNFILLMLPFLFLLFGAVSVSNLILLRREGKSPRNLLGVFMLLFFVGGTVLLFFGWDLVYQYVIFPIYARGNQWLQIVDVGLPLFFSGVLCYLECVMIGVSFYAVLAARHEPEYDKDFAVILGCAIRKDGSLTPLLRGRVDRAVAFARTQEEKTGKELIFVPSGGQGSDESISEAAAMKTYLLSCGIPEERIRCEDRSTNTEENMRFSRALIAREKSGARVVFSTTNYHVFRSGNLARHADFPAEGIGAGTKLYFWPNAFLREFVALIAERKKIHLIVAAVILLLSAAAGVFEFWAFRLF